MHNHLELICIIYAITGVIFTICDKNWRNNFKTVKTIGDVVRHIILFVIVNMVLWPMYIITYVWYYRIRD